MTDTPLPADVMAALQQRASWLWRNPARVAAPSRDPQITAEIAAAQDRLARAEGLIRHLFALDVPAGQSAISSPLIEAPALAGAPAGRWFIKGDHALPVAGSIKARGGFHEVIAYAERLALAAGLIAPGADLIALADPQVRALLARHKVVVGSTGNLGMSIGLCGAALGMQAVIHMSTDAKAWKKNRLRAHGAEVVEHAGDYGAAVAEGRARAAADPAAHFVDDEHSRDLFSGYACAAFELKAQLAAQGVTVDAQTPLIVHLPCGVGGAPGGIAYGLELAFGPHVTCYFAEPVEAPCMLVQLASGQDAPLSVYDIGLQNKTELDGLAVGLASPFVAPLMRPRLGGVYTVTDRAAHQRLAELYHASGIRIEPSAATALDGPRHVPHASATQISWTTGGALVPEAEFAAFLAKGAAES